MSKKSNVLGRGLNTVLGGSSYVEESISTLPIELLVPNAEQPRQTFSDETLHELANSIKHLGIIQPITVRPDDMGRYLIISGERRYRAAQMAGLNTLPVYIRKVDKGELLELALVENIQREDLNPIEIALTYQRLLEHPNTTQEDVARKVGKKRTTISNYLRLLQLPAEIQLGVSQGLLDIGHAKALLQVQDPERQLELYKLVIEQSLTVREVEELARAINTPHAPEEEPLAKRKGSKQPLPEEYLSLEKHLARVFATKVSLRYSKQGKGQISIPFGSEEELERIMLLLERIQQE